MPRPTEDSLTYLGPKQLTAFAGRMMTAPGRAGQKAAEAYVQACRGNYESARNLLRGVGLKP